MMLLVFALAGAVVLIPQPASAQAGCEAIIKAMNAEMSLLSQSCSGFRRTSSGAD